MLDSDRPRGKHYVGDEHTLLWLQGQGGVDAVSEHTGCGLAVVGSDCKSEVYRVQAVWIRGWVNDGTGDSLQKQPPASQPFKLSQRDGPAILRSTQLWATTVSSNSCCIMQLSS